MLKSESDFPQWLSERGARVLDHAREEIARCATDPGQQRLMRQALESSGCARFPQRYHASMHLPLLVHAAVTGEDAPAIPLAAACTLLWAGAELYDNLTDGDLDEPWRECAPFRIVFTATAVGAVLPPAMVAALAVPWERRERMLADLATGMLHAFEGQARDLELTGAREPSPAAVEASVLGKNGAPKRLFAGLAARMAGADANTCLAYADFARALGAIFQFHSDHVELFFSSRCRDLEHGTRTLQVAIRIAALAGEEREAFVALLGRARSDHGARDQVRSQLRRADVLRPWANVLRRRVKEAEAALEAARPAEPAGAILRGLIRSRAPRCA